MTKGITACKYSIKKLLVFHGCTICTNYVDRVFVPAEFTMCIDKYQSSMQCLHTYFTYMNEICRLMFERQL